MWLLTVECCYGVRIGGESQEENTERRVGPDYRKLASGLELDL